MVTITLKQVLKEILGALGMGTATAGLSDSQLSDIASQINTRVREGWRHAFWPETMLVEQRRYRPAWDGATNWAEGDEVFSVDRYFRSLVNGNVGNTPPASGDTAYWAEITSGMVLSLDFDQAGETRIARAENGACVFRRDPMAYGMGPGNAVATMLVGDRIVVTDSAAPAEPYVRFQPAEPQFSFEAWDDGTDYAEGDLVYLAERGECYRALQASTGMDPYSETGHWEPVGFPEFLRIFVKHGVAADRLLDERVSQSQEGKAQVELERLFDEKMAAQKEQTRARFGK